MWTHSFIHIMLFCFLANYTILQCPSLPKIHQFTLPQKYELVRAAWVHCAETMHGVLTHIKIRFWDHKKQTKRLSQSVRFLRKDLPPNPRITLEVFKSPTNNLTNVSEISTTVKVKSGGMPLLVILFSQSITQ